MNKLYKCALGLLTAFTLSFACFSSAYEMKNVNYITLTTDSRRAEIQNPNNDNICIINTFYSAYAYVAIYGTFNDLDSHITQFLSDEMYCSTDSTIIVRNNYGPSSITIFYFIDNSYTSLQCQIEYNLIPVDDVNANYCNLNFGMIDPRDCPTTEGSGAISWTPRFINDEQYPGTNLLNINIPEDIAHTVIYNEEETIVNVEGYNADENYINGILQKEKLTPTNKDIEEMITGFMVNYFPYLALAIVFLYLARKIYKIFK